MNIETRQSILSAVRSVLIAIGSLLATRGYVDEAVMQQLVGAIMVIAPLIWGVLDKLQSERDTKVREVIAVNVGIEVADNTAGKTPIVMPVDVPSVIAAVSPTLPAVLAEPPAVQSTKEVIP